MIHITFDSQFQSQIKKYLSQEVQDHPSFKLFAKAITQLSVDRDKELLQHAFHIAEVSSKTLNDLMNKEYKLKALTLEKLKEALKSFNKENDQNFDFNNDDPYTIIDYLNSEIQKRKQTEENYKGIVENSTTIIYKTNDTGNFIYANPVAERITGFKMEELLNTHFTNIIRPDKRSEASAFYFRQINENLPSTYYEFPILTKQMEEKWIGQSVQMEKRSDNKFEFTAVAIDITERVNYEKILLLQKEKYQSIITNMNLGLLEVDKNERIEFVNPGFIKISGFTKDDLIGKKATDLFVEKSYTDLVRNKIAQRAQGKSDMYEIPVRNKNGELRWWMISGAPNYDNKGNYVGSIGIHLDITDHKKIELELELAKSRAEDSSKAKESFLSNMSHEIRTPLNAIIGMIRELSKENLSVKQNTYVKNAYTASQHLLSVLNNILDISKIDAGELQLDLHNFNLFNTLNDIKTMMMAQAAEKGLELKLNRLENRNICVYGDSGRFRQVLLNLVGNAIKFTEKGQITISYEVEMTTNGFKTVTITVADTGIGMEDSFMEKIFSKFSQEDSSTSRKYGGSGLGMAITYELISLMNGTINVKSKKGYGTTILMKFLLPIGDPTKLVENTPIYLSSIDKPLEILLIEDNEFNRMVALDTLQNYKFNVTEAINGLQAIDILKKGKPFDVILMDLQMPVMNGFDATLKIRNELHIQTPIIALTANAFKSELEECIKIGMNDYVTKPFEEDKLLNTIYKFCRPASGKIMSETNEKKEITTTKLFNLDRISNDGKNDSTYINKMISIFIQESEKSIIQIEKAYKEGRLDTLYKIAHRIKPSIDGMGIMSLKDPIRIIEKDSKENINSGYLREQVQFLCKTLNDVIIELKKNIR